MKLWDVRKPEAPLQKYKIADYLDVDLQQKYDNDAIFDRFDLKWSPSGQYVSTCSYSDTFTVFKLSQSRTVRSQRKGSTSGEASSVA